MTAPEQLKRKRGAPQAPPDPTDPQKAGITQESLDLGEMFDWKSIKAEVEAESGVKIDDEDPSRQLAALMKVVLERYATFFAANLQKELAPVMTDFRRQAVEITNLNMRHASQLMSEQVGALGERIKMVLEAKHQEISGTVNTFIERADEVSASDNQDLAHMKNQWFVFGALAILVALLIGRFLR